jgi:hypothetical protein
MNEFTPKNLTSQKNESKKVYVENIFSMCKKEKNKNKKLKEKNFKIFGFVRNKQCIIKHNM